MKKWAAILSVISVLWACNNNADNTAGNAQDTLQEAVADAEVSEVQQSFPQLFQYLKAQDPAFSEDSFLLSGESKVEQVPPAAIDEKRLQPFRKYLVYNSDSSLALDLYSYNYIATSRDGRNSLEEAGPDSEAAVIDFKNNTRRRVFFGGPSYALWDAKWINQNELLLIGAETGEENKIIPTIWQVNLQDTSIQVYAYEGEVKADMNEYKRQKLDMGF